MIFHVYVIVSSDWPRVIHCGIHHFQMKYDVDSTLYIRTLLHWDDAISALWIDAFNFHLCTRNLFRKNQVSERIIYIVWMQLNENERTIARWFRTQYSYKKSDFCVQVDTHKQNPGPKLLQQQDSESQQMFDDGPAFKMNSFTLIHGSLKFTGELNFDL